MVKGVGRARRRSFGAYVVDVGVGDKKTVGVPQGDDDAFHHFFYPLVAVAEVVGFYHGGVHQKKPERVRPKAVDYLHGVGVVAQALAHFFAVSGKHEAAYNAVFERRFFEERRRQNGEGVKPAPRLVKPFVDKVRRKVAVEKFFVLGGVVALAVGHGP